MSRSLVRERLLGAVGSAHGALRELAKRGGWGSRSARAFDGRPDVSGLVRLEPRTLMTAFISEDLSSAFGLDETVYTLTPPAGGGAEVFGFGDAVAALGDIDGDGRPDFAIAAPGRAAIEGDEASPAINGLVFVYSGADASIIRTLGGDYDGFGFALANVGDIDGDDVPDLLVGSPSYVSDALVETARGRITVFSGADGSELFSLDGATGVHELGFAVAAAGDLNDDDVPDFLVGAPGASGMGEVLAISGADASVIFTLAGEHTGDRFGAAVAGGIDIGTAGETNTLPQYDGLPDIVVGAPGYDGPGAAVGVGAFYVFSGDGTLRAELPGGTDLGGNAGDALGSSVAIIDGTTIAAGAPGWDQDGLGGGAIDRGRVFIYILNTYGYPDNETFFFRGQDFHLVGQAAGERFGQSISSVGQLSTLAPHWIAITAPGAEGGGTSYLAVVENYLAGSGLLESGPDVGGRSIASVGDVNGDGIFDFLTGTQREGEPPAATVVPVFAMVEPAAVSGSSNSGEYLFGNPNQNNYYGYYTAGPTRLSQGYVMMDGVYTPFAEVPGLGEDVVLVSINDSGDLVGYDLVVSDPNYPQYATQQDPFVWRDGEKHYLSDLITNIIGPTDLNLNAIYLKRLGNNGDILFQEGQAQNFSGVPRAWHLRGNTLRHLWSGPAATLFTPSSSARKPGRSSASDRMCVANTMWPGSVTRTTCGRTYEYGPFCTTPSGASPEAIRSPSWMSPRPSSKR